jgi:hypothetical protein
MAVRPSDIIELAADTIVIAGLDPAMKLLGSRWMAGSSPAMTPSNSGLG